MTARTPDEIRRDIERTREELGQTAAALATKADVKARAHDKLDETRARFSRQVQDTRAKVSVTAGSAREKAAGATPETVQGGARQAVARARTTVQARPIPSAAVAGVVGGLLLGWMLGRR